MALDPQAFKDTLSRWASGVTIVTTARNGEWKGTTASSFISISLQPPTILISLKTTLYSRELIMETGVFAVSILNHRQGDIGRVFASMVPRIENRFSIGRWRAAESGCPILYGASGWVDCRLYETHVVGDHTLLIGEVESAGVSDADPMLYYRRQWGRFQP